MSLADRLRQALGPGVVFEGAENAIVYEYDYGLDRGMPDLVVLPRSTADVQVIVRALNDGQISFGDVIKAETQRDPALRELRKKTN